MNTQYGTLKVNDLIIHRKVNNEYMLPVERGNPVSCEKIGTLDKSIMALQANTFWSTYNPTAGADYARCNVDVYKLSYYTHDTRSTTVQKCSATLFVPETIEHDTILSIKHGAYFVTDKAIAWRGLKEAQNLAPIVTPVVMSATPLYALSNHVAPAIGAFLTEFTTQQALGVDAYNAFFTSIITKSSVLTSEPAYQTLVSSVASTLATSFTLNSNVDILTSPEEVSSKVFGDIAQNTLQAAGTSLVTYQNGVSFAAGVAAYSAASNVAATYFGGSLALGAAAAANSASLTGLSSNAFVAGVLNAVTISTNILDLPTVLSSVKTALSVTGPSTIGFDYGATFGVYYGAGVTTAAAAPGTVAGTLATLSGPAAIGFEYGSTAQLAGCNVTTQFPTDATANLGNVTGLSFGTYYLGGATFAGGVAAYSAASNVAATYFGGSLALGAAAAANSASLTGLSSNAFVAGVLNAVTITTYGLDAALPTLQTAFGLTGAGTIGFEVGASAGLAYLPGVSFAGGVAAYSAASNAAATYFGGSLALGAAAAANSASLTGLSSNAFVAGVLNAVTINTNIATLPGVLSNVEIALSVTGASAVGFESGAEFGVYYGYGSIVGAAYGAGVVASTLATLSGPAAIGFGYGSTAQLLGCNITTQYLTDATAAYTAIVTDIYNTNPLLDVNNITLSSAFSYLEQFHTDPTIVAGSIGYTFFYNIFNNYSAHDHFLAAINGNIVISPDGLGYGDSLGEPVMLSEDAEVFPSVDALRAFKHLTKLDPAIFGNHTFKHTLPVIQMGFSLGGIYSACIVDRFKTDAFIAQAEKREFDFKKVVSSAAANAYETTKYYCTEGNTCMNVSSVGDVFAFMIQVMASGNLVRVNTTANIIKPAVFDVLPLLTDRVTTALDITSAIPRFVEGSIRNFINNIATYDGSYKIPLHRDQWANGADTSGFYAGYMANTSLSNTAFYAGSNSIDLKQFLNTTEFLKYGLGFKNDIPALNPFKDMTASMNNIPFIAINGCHDEITQIGTNVILEPLYTINQYNPSLDTSVMTEVDKYGIPTGKFLGRANSNILTSNVYNPYAGYESIGSNIATLTGNVYERYTLDVVGPERNNFVFKLFNHAYISWYIYPLTVLSALGNGMASE
jgi:hypothetical protein